VDDATQHILDAILEGGTSAEDMAALPMPATYRAVTVHKDETEMFAGLATREKVDAACTSRRCPCPTSARARPWSR
jgi:hypothetical protein